MKSAAHLIKIGLICDGLPATVTLMGEDLELAYFFGKIFGPTPPKDLSNLYHSIVAT
jgi:hypothetical protein